MQIEWRFTCVRCGATVQQDCTCWVRLQCPDCNKQRTVERHDSDPGNAAVVLYACPNCRDTEPEDVRYFDKQGTEIYS